MNKSKATQSFEKQAKKLSVGDIEDDLGVYLPGKYETITKNLINKAYEDFYPLRHPVVSSLYSFGAAPANAKRLARSEIKDKLLRDHPGIRRRHNEVLEQRRLKARRAARERRLRERIETERQRATQPQRIVGTLADAYIKTKRREM